jgi:outer membrane receptor for ferrienterochelin and colicin
VAVLAMTMAMPLAGQQRSGSVEGVVHDQQGGALPGATVTLVGESIMGQRVAVTDEQGRFRIVLVPPGKYSIEAALPGFQSMKKDDVPVGLGQVAKLEFTLPTGKFEEAVQVVADQVLIDPTSSKVGGNITAELVATMPNDRQYQMVMAVLPGAIEANNPYMHGAAGADNMYLVDGADSSDPMTRTWSSAMNFDNLQEIQVITGGAAAEYGKGTGAVVNLVTKSGSNEFHGILRYTHSDEEWNEELRGDRYYFSDATKYTSEQRPSANLGGPILRDRLWFFASYEGRAKTKYYARFETPEDAVSRTYQSGNTDYEGHYYTGKLTLQPSPEHTIFATYMEDPIDIPELYAYLAYQNRAPEADNFREQGGWNALASWTGVLSPNSFVDAKYNVKRNVLNNLPIGSGFTYYTPANGGLYWGNATSDYRTDREHDIYAATYNHFFDTGGGGHEVKVGVEYADIGLNYYSESYPGGELIAYRNDAVTPDYRYVYRQRRGWIPSSNETWTVFVQDSWRVTPDLTVNLGLRFENSKDKNNLGDTIIDWGWSDRIQPRLGFAYNISGNSLHGSYGRFHDTVYTTISRTFSPVPDLIYDYYLWSASAGAWVFNRTFTVGASAASRDDIESPYMDEATLGFDAKLSSSMAWGVNAVYRVWKKGIEDNDGEAFGSNPAADGNYHYQNLGKFREYKGIELTLKKMLSGGKFQFLSSYTYSEAEGYWDDTDANATYRDNPYSFYNYWGPVSYDYNHVVKFNGSYFLPLGFLVGGNLSYLSGPPYSTTAQVRTSASSPWPSRNFSNYYLEPRGSNRLPDIWRMDLRFEWSHKFGPISAGLFADVFNVTDNQEAVAIDAYVGRVTLAGDEPGAAYTVTLPNANYGNYTQWQAPRSYFVGAKIEF